MNCSVLYCVPLLSAQSQAHTWAVPTDVLHHAGLRNRQWGGCVYVLQMVFLFFFCFVFFPSATKYETTVLGNGWTDFHETFTKRYRGKWSFQRRTQMGARPPNNFLGAKNWKIAIGAYSSELITPEWKQISQCLKRLWNHKTMAYKVYVRPWPLTPEVNTVHTFACTCAKIPGFWRFSQNFLL